MVTFCSLFEKGRQKGDISRNMLFACFWAKTSFFAWFLKPWNSQKRRFWPKRRQKWPKSAKNGDFGQKGDFWHFADEKSPLPKAWGLCFWHPKSAKRAPKTSKMTFLVWKMAKFVFFRHFSFLKTWFFAFLKITKSLKMPKMVKKRHFWGFWATCVHKVAQMWFKTDSFEP